MTRRIEPFALHTKLEVEATQGLGQLALIERKLKGFTGAFSGALGTVSKEGSEGIRKMQGLGSAFSGLVGPASMAVGAFAAVGASIVGTGTAIFALMQKAAEFGSKIHDIAQQTGLGAETISSLKFAADQSNSSIEEFSKGMKKFSITVAESARGSEEAGKKLERLGVNPKTAILNLDKALGQALRSIAKAPPGILRTERAADAFGSKLGASLIPTILSFDGNLEDLIARVKKLGGTLSDAQADEFDKFGDAFDTLKAQAAGLGNQLAAALAPEFTRAMGEISLAISENGAAFREWGRDLGDAISGIRALVQSDAFQELYTFLKFTSPLRPGVIIGALSSLGAGSRAEEPAEDVFGPGGVMRGGRKNLPGTREYKERAGLLAGLADMEDDAREKAAKSAKTIADPLAAFKRILETSALAVRFFGKETEEARIEQALLAAGLDKITNPALKQQALLLADIAIKNAKIIDVKKELAEHEEKIQKELDVAAEARDALFAKQEEKQRFAQFGPKSELDLLNDEIVALNKLHGGLTEKETQDLRIGALAISSKKNADEWNDALGSLADTMGEVIDFEKQMADIGLTLEGMLGPPPAAPVDKWKETFTSLKDIGGEALRSLSAGIGDLGAQWVLLGDQAELSMGKLVASVLAGVMAQAATLAIMETAYGIAALTPWGAIIFGPASLHFQAAALFAAVAAGAGALGRIAAGDKFQQKPEHRAMGGPVRQGQPYIVGERSPELFIPSSDGWIHPRGGTGGNGAIASLEEAIRLLHSKIGSMRPGDVVTAGAHGLIRAYDQDAGLIRLSSQRHRLA